MHFLPEFILSVNPSNSDLNPICRLLALLGAHHILHVSRIRVKDRCILYLGWARQWREYCSKLRRSWRRRKNAAKI